MRHHTKLQNKEVLCGRGDSKARTLKVRHEEKHADLMCDKTSAIEQTSQLISSVEVHLRENDIGKQSIFSERSMRLQGPSAKEVKNLSTGAWGGEGGKLCNVNSVWRQSLCTSYVGVCRHSVRRWRAHSLACMNRGMIERLSDSLSVPWLRESSFL